MFLEGLRRLGVVLWQCILLGVVQHQAKSCAVLGSPVLGASWILGRFSRAVALQSRGAAFCSVPYLRKPQEVCGEAGCGLSVEVIREVEHSKHGQQKCPCFFMKIGSISSYVLLDWRAQHNLFRGFCSLDHKLFGRVVPPPPFF